MNWRKIGKQQLRSNLKKGIIVKPKLYFFEDADTTQIRNKGSEIEFNKLS